MQLLAILAAILTTAQPVDAQPDALPNAAEGYRYAWALMRTDEWREIEEAIGEEPLPDDVVKILTSGPTPKALRYLRQAAAMRHVQWEDDAATGLPTLSKLRATARLLAGEEARTRQAGDFNTAAAVVDAMLGLSTHAARVGAEGDDQSTIAWLVGVAIAHLSLERIELQLEAETTAHPASNIASIRAARAALIRSDAQLILDQKLGMDKFMNGEADMSKQAVMVLDALAADVALDPTVLDDPALLQRLTAEYGAVVPMFIADIVEVLPKMQETRDMLATRLDEIESALTDRLDP